MCRLLACTLASLLLVACIPDKSGAESTKDARVDTGESETDTVGTVTDLKDSDDLSPTPDKDAGKPPEDVQSETTCLPNCHGKACGDDGCGGECGECGKGDECAAGQCEPASCVGGYCMEEHPSGCSCAYGCEETGNCCSDFCDVCPGTCAGNPCGEVKYEGCCDGQFNTWCENGQIVTEDCSVNPLCGWNKNKQFHDCNTNGEEDPTGNWPKECK